MGGAPALGHDQYLPLADYAMPFLAGAVGIGDVDCDGRNDLVVFGDGVVMVLLQSRVTDGTFEVPRPIR